MLVMPFYIRTEIWLLVFLIAYKTCYSRETNYKDFHNLEYNFDNDLITENLVENKDGESVIFDANDDELLEGKLRSEREASEYADEQMDDSPDSNNAEFHLFSWWKGLPDSKFLKDHKSSSGVGGLTTKSVAQTGLTTASGDVSSTPSVTTASANSTASANATGTIAGAGSNKTSNASTTAKPASTYLTTCYTITDTCAPMRTLVAAPICTEESTTSSSLPGSASTANTTKSASGNATTSVTGNATNTATTGGTGTTTTTPVSSETTIAVTAALRGGDPTFIVTLVFDKSVTSNYSQHRALGSPIDAMSGMVIPIYQIAPLLSAMSEKPDLKAVTPPAFDGERGIEATQNVKQVLQTDSMELVDKEMRHIGMTTPNIDMGSSILPSTIDVLPNVLLTNAQSHVNFNEADLATTAENLLKSDNDIQPSIRFYKEVLNSKNTESKKYTSIGEISQVNGDQIQPQTMPNFNFKSIKVPNLNAVNLTVRPNDIKNEMDSNPPLTNIPCKIKFYSKGNSSAKFPQERENPAMKASNSNLNNSVQLKYNANFDKAVSNVPLAGVNININQKPVNYSLNSIKMNPQSGNNTNIIPGETRIPANNTQQDNTPMTESLTHRFNFDNPFSRLSTPGSFELNVTQNEKNIISKQTELMSHSSHYWSPVSYTQKDMSSENVMSDVTVKPQTSEVSTMMNNGFNFLNIFQQSTEPTLSSSPSLNKSQDEHDLILQNRNISSLLNKGYSHANEEKDESTYKPFLQNKKKYQQRIDFNKTGSPLQGNITSNNKVKNINPKNKVIQNVSSLYDFPSINDFNLLNSKYSSDEKDVEGFKNVETSDYESQSRGNSNGHKLVKLTREENESNFNSNTKVQNEGRGSDVQSPDIEFGSSDLINRFSSFKKKAMHFNINNSSYRQRSDMSDSAQENDIKRTDITKNIIVKPENHIGLGQKIKNSFRGGLKLNLIGPNELMFDRSKLERSNSDIAKTDYFGSVNSSDINNPVKVYYKYNDSFLAEQSKSGQNLVDLCKNVTCTGDNVLSPCCGSRQMFPQGRCQGQDLSYLLPIPGLPTSTTIKPNSSSTPPQNISNTYKEDNLHNMYVRVPRGNMMDNLVRFQLMHGVSAPDSKDLLNALREVNLQAQKVNREFHPLGITYNERQAFPQNIVYAPQISEANPLMENVKSTLTDSRIFSPLGQSNEGKDKYRKTRNYGFNEPPDEYNESNSQPHQGRLRKHTGEEGHNIMDLQILPKQEDNFSKDKENNLKQLKVTNNFNQREFSNANINNFGGSGLVGSEPKAEDIKGGSYLKLVQEMQKSNIGNDAKDLIFDRYSEIRSNASNNPLPPMKFDKSHLDKGFNEPYIPNNSISVNTGSFSKFQISDNNNYESVKRFKRSLEEIDEEEKYADINPDWGLTDINNTNSLQETFDTVHNDLFNLQKYIISNVIGEQSKSAGRDYSEPSLKNVNISSMMELMNEVNKNQWDA